MPHKATVLMSTNRVTGDPGYVSERNAAIAGANTIEDLVVALDLGDDGELVEAASAADGFLPPAVVQTILSAYKGAAATGTDGVFVTWMQSSGFSATVAHARGSDASSRRGVVSLTVKSPPLGDG